MFYVIFWFMLPSGLFVRVYAVRVYAVRVYAVRVYVAARYMSIGIIRSGLCRSEYLSVFRYAKFTNIAITFVMAKLETSPDKPYR